MTTQCPKCRFDNPPDTSFCGKCGTPIPSAAVTTPFSQTETFLAWKDADPGIPEMVDAKKRLAALKGQ